MKKLTIAAVAAGAVLAAPLAQAATYDGGALSIGRTLGSAPAVERVAFVEELLTFLGIAAVLWAAYELCCGDDDDARRRAAPADSGSD